MSSGAQTSLPKVSGIRIVESSAKAIVPGNPDELLKSVANGSLGLNAA